MSDSYQKVNPSINKSPSKSKEKTPTRAKEDEYANMTMLEKIKAKEASLKEKQKKSMDAWGDTGETKQFGVRKALFFSLGRIWRGNFRQKLLLLFNLLLLIIAKAVQVINPIFLMLAVNGILCEPED